jgi:hypothetical protein
LKERIRKENKNRDQKKTEDKAKETRDHNKAIDQINKGVHNKIPIVHRKEASNVGRIVRLNNREEINKYKEYIK